MAMLRGDYIHGQSRKGSFSSAFSFSRLFPCYKCYVPAGYMPQGGVLSVRLVQFLKRGSTAYIQPLVFYHKFQDPFVFYALFEDPVAVYIIFQVPLLYTY